MIDTNAGVTGSVLPRLLALRLALDAHVMDAMVALAAAWIYLELAATTPRQLARRAATACGGAAGACGRLAVRALARGAKRLTRNGMRALQPLASRLLYPWRQPLLASVQPRSDQ